MLILIKVEDDNAYVLDTLDSTVDILTAPTYAQAKALGIRIEDSFVDVLSKIEVGTLVAGFYDEEAEDVLAKLGVLHGLNNSPKPFQNSKPSLSKLVSVVPQSSQGFLKQMRYTENQLSKEGYFDKFDSLLNSLGNFSEEDGIYDDDSGVDGVESTFDEDDDINYDDDDGVEYDYEDDDSEYNYSDDDESADSKGSIRKLYNRLSAVQIDLLNEYYRWFAKRVFKEESNTLKLDSINSRAYQDWKKSELSSLRGDEDWEYDGFIDTGEYPGDYCEMGHPLRYVHYAKGLISGRCVKFGSKCISDFFKVDSVVMRSIIRAQRESSSDLVELDNLYSNQESIDNAFSSFDILKFVVSNLSSKDNSEEVLFIKKFDDAELIYPKSLVKLFKKQLYRTNDLSKVCFTGRIRTKILSLCYGSKGGSVDSLLLEKSYTYSNFSTQSLCYPKDIFAYNFSCLLDLTFNIKLDGIYKYNPVIGLNVRGEGGKSKRAKGYYSNREVSAMSTFLYSTFSSELDTLSALVDLISSVISINNLFSTFKNNWKKPYLIAYNAKYKNISVVEKCKKACEDILKSVLRTSRTSDMSFGDAYKNFIESSNSVQTFKFGFSEICRSVTLDEKPEKEQIKEELDSLDYSILGISKTIGIINDYLMVVESSEFGTTFTKLNSFSLDVFKSVKQYKRMSEKQKSVIVKLVTNLKDTLLSMTYDSKPADLTSTSSLPDDVLHKVDRALEILNDGKNLSSVLKVVPTGTILKLKSILTTVATRRFASEKQMYYITLAKKVVFEIDGN